MGGRSAALRFALPPGFVYQPEFVSETEESELLANIGKLEFSEVRMHGVVARRRVVHLGWLYGYESWKIEPGPPIPAFLFPVRERLAALAKVAADELGEALVTKYPAGATIGWHRDAPPFGIVTAISLLASCRFRFRRETEGGFETRQLDVQPRSAYVIAGEARTKWQHSTAPVKSLRYSITFRTLRKRGQ